MQVLITQTYAPCGIWTRKRFLYSSKHKPLNQTMFKGHLKQSYWQNALVNFSNIISATSFKIAISQLPIYALVIIWIFSMGMCIFTLNNFIVDRVDRGSAPGAPLSTAPSHFGPLAARIPRKPVFTDLNYLPSESRQRVFWHWKRNIGITTLHLYIDKQSDMIVTSIQTVTFNLVSSTCNLVFVTHCLFKIWNT